MNRGRERERERHKRRGRGGRDGGRVEGWIGKMREKRGKNEREKERDKGGWLQRGGSVTAQYAGTCVTRVYVC